MPYRKKLKTSRRQRLGKRASVAKRKASKKRNTTIREEKLMLHEIDLQHLDAHWLDVISKAAQGALEKIDKESREGPDNVSPEQVAIATMAGGFLYLYHLAQVNHLIDRDNTPMTYH